MSLVRQGGPKAFTAELDKKASGARDLAHSTTSLTYAICKLYITIPKLLTDKAKADAATQLNGALTLKGFACPVSVQKRIDHFIKLGQAVAL